MSTTQQPEALRLADAVRTHDDHPRVHFYNRVAAELRRLHAENQDLRARLQELGEIARENRSKKVIELEGRIAELESEAEQNAKIIGASAETELALRGRIAEMEEQMAAIGAGGVEPLRKSASQQAAHHAEGVPEQAGTYAEARECEHCNHVGINDAANGIASCMACKWNGDSPKEDKCPDCEAEGAMTASCPKCHHEYRLIADATLAATHPTQQGLEKDAEAIRTAVLSCGHTIERDFVTLWFEEKKEGHNALNQLGRRIAAALAAQAKHGGTE